MPLVTTASVQPNSQSLLILQTIKEQNVQQVITVLNNQVNLSRVLKASTIVMKKRLHSVTVQLALQQSTAKATELKILRLVLTVSSVKEVMSQLNLKEEHAPRVSSV